MAASFQVVSCSALSPASIYVSVSGSVSDMACSPGPFAATAPTVLTDVVKATQRLPKIPKQDRLRYFRPHGQRITLQCHIFVSLLMQGVFVSISLKRCLKSEVRHVIA